MFEREYKDMEFVPRWSIVRKIRTQFLSSHSYLVAIYTNDLCIFFGVNPSTHLCALQYALWHDVDEIFSGDMAGPAKRRLVTDKKGWKDGLHQLMASVFGPFYKTRSGETATAHPADTTVAQLIVKTADWLEAAMEMAAEYQLGNRNVEHHLVHDLNMAVQTAHLVCDAMKVGGPGYEYKRRIEDSMRSAVRKQQETVSRGPLTDPAERAIAESLRLISPSS